jgi:hypothetical protein
MKAMVVVFSPASNGHVSPEAALGLNRGGPLEQLPVLTGGNYGVRQLKRDQGPQPFWTWFIENPRRSA